MTRIFLAQLLILLLVNIAHTQDLKRYTCLIDRIDIEGFKENKSFDKKGILKANGRYHPLSISQLGVLNYYHFLETRDSSYYFSCVDQFSYFQDTTKIDFLFEGKGIGLPYRFSFWDMKSPWYSGMTQGYALSFLLRYYKLTNDSTALDISKKIAYTLLQRQEDGGTISTTREGFLWIEEYPNSEKSPQVLNGFINGFIGLKEYSDFFPDDTLAKRILKATYIGLVNSLPYFDSKNWSYYNRANKSISKYYLRYQIYEMKHLFEIFGDTIFRNQMKIWSTMVHNKFISIDKKLIKFPRYNPSEVASQISDGLYGFIPEDSLTIIDMGNTNIQQFNSYKKLKDHIKDRNPLFKRKAKKETYYLISSENTESINFVKFACEKSEHNEFTFFKKSGEELIRLKNVISFKDSDYQYFFIDDSSLNELVIHSDIVGDSLVDKFTFHNTNQMKVPFFIHYTSDIIALSKDVEYSLDILKRNTEDVSIFYKKAADEKILKSRKWIAGNTLSDQLIPREDEVYQFLIVGEWKHPLSFIGELKVSFNQTLILSPKAPN